MSADTPMRADEREAIRDLLHRYCRAIDRRDLELLRGCYHLDSVDQHASFTGSGPEFCDYAMRQVAKAVFTQHRLSNILIEFDGERAFVESYVNSVHRMRADGKLLDFIHHGRYCDIVERRDGAWRIAYRLHLPDGDSVGEIEEPVGRRSAGEEGGRYYARGIPGPTDPSYLRFGAAQARRDVAPIDGMFEGYIAEREKTA